MPPSFKRIEFVVNLLMNASFDRIQIPGMIHHRIGKRFTQRAAFFDRPMMDILGRRNLM
uniref:Uncharacterized protein n=1 Tax=Ralstonia solanacearum TaxID=305 RepID=A0A0S4WN95_RALSL|nr:protein of unknown function [Ralstonia solanacearum]